MTKTQQTISQTGELYDMMTGGITGAQLVVETVAGGYRYEVTGAHYEATSEHPQGRLVLHVSRHPHHSSTIQS